MTIRRGPARPLHARIRAGIEQRIASGVWKPGHPVPSEALLAARYGCSRMTVNKVLSELAREGLVQRRRRAGTVVAQPGASAAVLAIPDLAAEAAARGAEYAYVLLSRRCRRATAADRARCEVPVGTRVLALECLHSADGRPWAYEDRLISLATVPEALTADFGADVPGTWLRAHVPWTEAEHRIRADAAGRTVAQALQLPLGAPLLVVERRTWRAAAPVTHVLQRFPADAHVLVARFAPGGRSGGAGA